MEYIFCLLECMCLNKISKTHTALLLTMSSQHDALNVVDQQDILCSVKMTRDLGGTIMTESRRADIALKQDCKGILLFY